MRGKAYYLEIGITISRTYFLCMNLRLCFKESVTWFAMLSTDPFTYLIKSTKLNNRQRM